MINFDGTALLPLRDPRPVTTLPSLTYPFPTNRNLSTYNNRWTIHTISRKTNTCHQEDIKKKTFMVKCDVHCICGLQKEFQPLEKKTKTVMVFNLRFVTLILTVYNWFLRNVESRVKNIHTCGLFSKCPV